MIVTKIEDLKTVDFLAGVSFLVDKPLSWTSFDVVNKIRFLLKSKLGVKKIKVGHAGTLDPLATGLLIIAIGKDTKMIETYQGMIKSYSGVMRIGATTKSFDSEFEPDQFYRTDHIDAAMLEEKRKAFIGVIEQVPPAFSALKVQGERAYALARKGKTPELKSRKVEILDFTIDVKEFPDISFEVVCEKGTYIRSLANDFGKALGSGAYLTVLRRTAIGHHHVRDAFTIDCISGVLSTDK